MRLYLLPISTRRTLLYCKRLNVQTVDRRKLIDKVTERAAKLWADWETRGKGWQGTVVHYGNRGLRRIPYEEWGLKSVPPLSARRRAEELQPGQDKVQLVFPKDIIPASRASAILNTLAVERDALHRSRLIWCLVGMPLTAPFAIIPIIPNLPFFYLLYRAWSHWRALAGGKHLKFLLANKLVEPTPSPLLASIYPPTAHSLPTAMNPEPAVPKEGAAPKEETAPPPGQELMMLSQSHGRDMYRALQIPELEVELERAIWQVETALQKQKEEKEEKEKKTTAAPATPSTNDDEKKRV